MPTSSPNPADAPADSDLVDPGLDLDYGVITSGLCDSEQAQADFDQQQAGKAPALG